MMGRMKLPARERRIIRLSTHFTLADRALLRRFARARRRPVAAVIYAATMDYLEREERLGFDSS